MGTFILVFLVVGLSVGYLSHRLLIPLILKATDKTRKRNKKYDKQIKKIFK